MFPNQSSCEKHAWECDIVYILYILRLGLRVWSHRHSLWFMGKKEQKLPILWIFVLFCLFVLCFLLLLLLVVVVFCCCFVLVLVFCFCFVLFCCCCFVCLFVLPLFLCFYCWSVLCTFCNVKAHCKKGP